MSSVQSYAFSGVLWTRVSLATRKQRWDDMVGKRSPQELHDSEPLGLGIDSWTRVLRFLTVMNLLDSNPITTPQVSS
jgi:hypothetical protein